MIKATLHTLAVLCLLVALPLSSRAQTKSSTVQEIDGKKFYIHKILKGQSLYAISKTYSVSIEELYSFNPDLKTNGAKADQEIRIPFAAPVTAAVPTQSTSTLQPDTNKYYTHQISKGETVYAITRRYKITEKELANYNPGLTPALREGQWLVVGEKHKKKTKTKEVKQPAEITKHKAADFNIVDSTLFKPVIKPRKEKYKIALILPFRFEQTLAIDLNELLRNNGSFPLVPEVAVDFYLGFKSVIDSLRNKSFDVELSLYESDDRDTVMLQQIINDPKFKDLDLIFGPLYASGFKTISKKAKEYSIPIISPITTQNKILFNNIYISKTNPSQFTLMESLADYCIDSLKPEENNIILMLLSDKDKKEIAYVNAFKKYYNDKQRALGKGLKDTVTMAQGISALKTALKPNTKNIIVTLSFNEVFLADFTTQLSIIGDRKNITLCGWQSLTESDNIDQEYLNQFNYTFPHQFNITSKATYGTAQKNYIAQQQCTPGEYFYRSFDIAYYYLSHLKSIGPHFVHELGNLPMETGYTRFKYARPDEMTGFDNRGVFIFKYDNYQLLKTGWK